jgi:hypothetical protein
MRVQIAFAPSRTLGTTRRRPGIPATLVLGAICILAMAPSSQPRMSVSGIIVDASGKGVQGMKVEGNCIPAGQSVDALVVVSSAVTASDGRFIVRDLPAGRCSLQAIASWGSCSSTNPWDPCSKTTATIVVQVGVNVQNVTLTAPPPPKPTGGIAGRVVAAKGQPLAGYAVFAACDAADPAESIEDQSETTAADGVFALTRLPPGSCRLRLATCDDERCTPLSVSQPFDPCAAEESCLNVTVAANAEQTGVVLTAGGRR